MAIPLIRSFMTVSTAHVPRPFIDPERAGDLNEGFTMCERGLWIWVPQDPAQHYDLSADDDDRDAAIDALRRYARARGCDYILCDFDGQIVEGLATFPSPAAPVSAGAYPQPLTMPALAALQGFPRGMISMSSPPCASHSAAPASDDGEDEDEEGEEGDVVRITVTLEIRGDAEEAMSAVDAVLDDGVFQDSINDTGVRVVAATSAYSESVASAAPAAS